MTTPNNWIGLRLDPLDTLFFRDGRPFDAATRASGGLPQPQTLAGALRTALLARTGFDFAKFAKARRGKSIEEALEECNGHQAIIDAEFRGPWLGLAADSGVTPLLSLPETLKRGKDGGWSVAKPVTSVPGWHDVDGLQPCWREVPADTKADPELLTFPALRNFLVSGTTPNDCECIKTQDLYGYDNRIGIGIDMDTLTSGDSLLYSISLLSMKTKSNNQSICMYAEMTLPDNLKTTLIGEEGLVLPFGGEGKYVHVTEVNKQDWPEYDPNMSKSLWYLASPTFLPVRGKSKRSLPAINGSLVAAMSGAGLPISGWDVARNGPKGTRFAVPAGAVYFVNGAGDPEKFLSGDNGTHSKHLRQVGWGFALQGNGRDYHNEY